MSSSASLRNRATEMYRVVAIDHGSTVQSCADILCFICRKGRTRRVPVTQCTLRHNYLRTLQQEFVCLTCLQRRFRISAADIERIRTHNMHTQQQRSYSRVFTLAAAAPRGDQYREHPLVNAFFERHEQGKTIPPQFAADVMCVLLVYANDPDLYEKYCWLVAPSSENPSRRFAGLRVKFEGVGNVWPTLEERQRVTDIMAAEVEQYHTTTTTTTHTASSPERDDNDDDDAVVETAE